MPNDLFSFENSYANELEGFYAPWQGQAFPTPKIVELNRDLATELGLDADRLNSDEGAAVLAGSVAPPSASPLAQVYAGHQFGGFAPQLGDGRALLVGELIDRNGARRDLHLKGSGPTPFSRRGDGRAVLGPVLREYLVGEAMYALGIPTSRALAAVTTGDQVMRDGLQPGAVLARVASSHLRVGTFEFFAARGESTKVGQLADYAIQRHYPEAMDADNPYLALLREVRDRQASLVARWMSVGFVHGVMNTDNTTISGETLDYGPCAFMESYDPAAVFSSIDHQGRYAYGNQPAIMQWNLARLASTLLPLIEPEDEEHAVRLATQEIELFPGIYEEFWLDGMRAKLGFVKAEEGDLDLVASLLDVMHTHSVDFTTMFRSLTASVGGNVAVARAQFDDPTAIDPWLSRWSVRLDREKVSLETLTGGMNQANPVFIPRNHKVEEAIEAAVRESDLGPFRTLLELLECPFEPRAGMEAYEGPAPADFGKYETFCGT